MNKVPIQILKSYRLENGDISGMFKIPADKVTKSIRIALIELEGALATVSMDPETPENAPADPLGEALRLSESLVLALNEAKEVAGQGGSPEESPQGALNGLEGEKREGFCDTFGVTCEDAGIDNAYGEVCDAPCGVRIARRDGKEGPTE